MQLPLFKDAGDLRGKRVLLRLDLNLSIQNGRVTDTYRLDRVQRTLEFLRMGGAKTLVVSHLENKETSGAETVVPVFEAFRQRFPAVFAKNLAEAQAELSDATDGSFTVLENVRTWAGEKKNDVAFARELASLADLYVNDAFAASHREHASIVGVPKLIPGFAGFLLEEEVRELSKAFAPGHPALVILGGAKFETKMPLVKRFLASADNVVVCGALANDIYKWRGYETGISLVSKELVDLGEVLEDPKLYVPIDVVTRDGEVVSKSADVVLPNEKIVDAGPDSLEDIRELIEKAAFVLWNGPLGEYESGFEKGTVALAQMLAECDAETIIGGGDSLAVVSKLGLLERFSFVSTGGGAMLEFLAKGTLPGISALQQAQNQPSSVISAPYNPSQG